MMEGRSIAKYQITGTKFQDFRCQLSGSKSESTETSFIVICDLLLGIFSHSSTPNSSTLESLAMSTGKAIVPFPETSAVIHLLSIEVAYLVF